ncbi:O-antigen ligase family protein [Thermodesulfobacteriota bacterium]
MGISKTWRRPNILELTRMMFVAELIGLLFSTSLAVMVEILIYLSFIGTRSLRLRARYAIKQPMAFMSLIWAGFLIIAALYGIESPKEIIADLSSWRKIFLLPLAAAIFDDDKWKLRFVRIFLGIVTLSALLSLISIYNGEKLYKFPPGILIMNHATQGMMFSVGAFSSALFLYLGRNIRTPESWFLLFSVLLLSLNLIFITPGRSGYLAFGVLCLALPLYLARPRYRFAAVGAVLLLIAIAFYISPVAKNRIMQGILEIENYKKDKVLTSLGTRMVVWHQTLRAIQERPFWGAGTGGFVAAYRLQEPKYQGWQGSVFQDPHNQFLRILAEQGLIGLILFSMLIYAFFIQDVSGWPKVLATGVVIAWCATSLFSSHFSTFTEGRFIYLWCGVLLSPVQHEK